MGEMVLESTIQTWQDPPPSTGEPVDDGINGMDSDRINSAIKTLFYGGGGTLRLGNGKYLLGKPIRLREGVSIVGDSAVFAETGGVVLEVQSDISAFDTQLVGGRDLPDCRSVTLENMCVRVKDGITSGNNGLNGVNLRYNVILKNLYFKYFYNGILLEYAWKITLDNVVCCYNLNSGLVVKNSGNRVTIRDGEFNENGVCGIKLTKGAFYNANILIQGNLCDGNNYGIWVDHTDMVTIMNNYMETNDYAGVLLRGEPGYENGVALVIGNRFFGNSDATKGDYGIDTRIYTPKYEVFGNSFVSLEVAGMRVTKGIIEGQIRTNDWRTSVPIEYTGTGYTPLVANNGSIDHKGFNPLKNVTINPQ